MKKHEKKIKQQDDSIQIPENILAKYKENRNGIIIILIALAITLGSSALYLDTFKKRTQRSWLLINEVINDNINTNLKVRDLDEKLQKKIEAVLGNEVDDRIKKILTKGNSKTQVKYNIKRLPVKTLPRFLKNEVLRKYNITRLEKQYQLAKFTNAAPWLAYCLEKLYYQDNQPAKALIYCNLIKENYEKHPLSDQVVQYNEASALKNEFILSNNDISSENNQNKNKDKGAIAIFSTTKGKFQMKIFEKQVPSIAQHFKYLANLGIYDGINFYQITPDRIYTGSSLGNGEATKQHVKNLKIKNTMPQKALVAMVSKEDEDKIDSRFFILKKYPWTRANERYAIVGKIVKGMDIVDKLEPTDILLDVTIK